MRFLIAAVVVTAACGGGQIHDLSLSWRGADATARPSASVAASFASVPIAFGLRDVRPDPTAVGTDEDSGSVVRTRDNVARYCSDHFGHMLRNAGARLDEPPVAVLDTDLLDYRVDEGGTFKGLARVRVTVRRAGGADWSKTYEGTSNRWGRSHNPENLNEALSNALAEVMERLVHDDEFARTRSGSGARDGVAAGTSWKLIAMSTVAPDVLIIGAGPAGSVAAALLAQRGYKVLVVERQHFPRFSIGESLLAYSTQLLLEAGLLDAVLAAGFQFKNGATFVCDEQYSEFNFADKFTTGASFTFQVLRSKFDHVLAREAERHGATVRYGIEITAVSVGDRPSVTARSEGGEVEIIRPRFVLDASGFGRTLAKLLELEKPSDFPVRAARFCHVKDGIVAGEFDRQKIRIGINPNNRDVWSWLIPFPDGTSSLGIVATREHLARYTGSDEAKYWAMVGHEPKLRALLADAHTVRPVGEIVGFAANVKTLHGQGFALLGNAAEFLDPVFSSGVTIALHSAKLAAALLDRQFRGEPVSWQQEFAEPLMFGIETFRTFVTGWYDGSLQDVIFHPNKEPQIHRMICSVLAGYAWDAANPYNGPLSTRRLRALAAVCRDGTVDRVDATGLS